MTVRLKLTLMKHTEKMNVKSSTGANGSNEVRQYQLMREEGGGGGGEQGAGGRGAGDWKRC